MGNGLKGLILAAGVVITCIVVGIGFYITREAKNMAGEGMSQMSRYAEEMSNGDVEFYNGLIISGKEVERAITKLYGKNGIWVIPKGGASSYYDESTANVEASVKKMELYENGSFLGSIQYNADGKIKFLVFTQQ